MAVLDARIRRCVPALVTPCTADGAPDLGSMRRLVRHVLDSSADAIVVLGSTGEFSLVPPRYRAEIITAAVSAAAGQPVVVGCGRPSIAETAHEIAEAAAAGASAALVTPSYYFPLAEEEVEAFFHDVAARSPLPLLYYHYPEMTGARVSPALIAGLARSGVIAGIKDSGGDAAFFARVESLVDDDFRLFVGGSANLLGALALGADGVTGALGNFANHLDRAVIDAFNAGDMKRAREAQAAVVATVDAVFFSLPRNAAATTKAILAELGICGVATFAPIAAVTPAEADALRRVLPSLGLKARAA